MNKAFTLIELMIVVGIIATISAIAIPNLLEARITANEAAAASSLKSGIYPAQIQFQNSGMSDVDGDGRGEYANDLSAMAGANAATPGHNPAWPGLNHSMSNLHMLPDKFNVPDDQDIGGYKYESVVSPDLDADGQCQDAESYFVVMTCPTDPGGTGRRFFAIGTSGMVMAGTHAVEFDDMTNQKQLLDGDGALNFDSCPWKGSFSPKVGRLAPYTR